MVWHQSCLMWNDWIGYTVHIKTAVMPTNLTDGAHGSHVAFIAWAVLGWGQQWFGVEEGFGVQGVQASIDWNLTHRTQVTVAPDLQFGGVLSWNPARGNTGVICNLFPFTNYTRYTHLCTQITSYRCEHANTQYRHRDAHERQAHTNGHITNFCLWTRLEA